MIQIACIAIIEVDKVAKQMPLVIAADGYKSFHVEMQRIASELKEMHKDAFKSLSISFMPDMPTKQQNPAYCG